jgi:hypothetical protein
MRAVVRLVTVLAVFLGVAVVQLPASQAVEVPQTLADRHPVGVGMVVPPFSIDHLGVIWDVDSGVVEDGHHDEAGHGEVRFRSAGRWTAWQALAEDGANAPGQWASALVPGGDAEAYQVRGIPAGAVAPRAVALNTTDGPPVEVGRRPVDGANAMPNCLSRAEWGADENLRFDSSGNEIWPPEFYGVQTMTTHHTATANDDSDPAGTVRAIYRYHAVDRGWGDIGYHYLIDESGRIYEGRWSGTASAPCGGADGGAEFAHDDNDGLVTAGHTGGYNSGNMGAALLGTFTTHRKNGAEPEPAAVDALETLLAEFATRHGLNPHATVDYVNPVTGDLKTVNMISGHRDWTSTECPGDRLYDDLPAIRDAVAAQMAALAVSLSSPTDGDILSGNVTVVAEAPEATSVTFSVGETEIGIDIDGTDGWTSGWDTTTFAEGGHTVTATATDGSATGLASVSVTVDNVAEDPLGVTGVTPNSGKTNSSVAVEITGTGFAAGATVELRDGDGSQPTVSGVTVVDAGTITATINIPAGGPPRDRPWDVVVTNPDGVSAVLADGFIVLR